jgi:hypothetical protein
MFLSATTGNPLTWTVADVGKWLVSIEKSKFCASFKDNEIDGSCLKIMDDASLLALGVTLPVHRNNLLERIKQLFALKGSHSFTPTSITISPPYVTHHRLHHCPNRYHTHFLCYSHTLCSSSLFAAYTDEADYPHDLSIYD